GYANRAIVMAQLGRPDRAKADLAILANLDKDLYAKADKAVHEVVVPNETPQATDRQAFYPDEEYQEDLRRLSDAGRADPDNPDPLAALAEYINDPKVDREVVFPNGVTRRFTFRLENNDYGRERAVLAKAFKLDPNHLGAIVEAAAMLSN